MVGAGLLPTRLGRDSAAESVIELAANVASQVAADLATRGENRYNGSPSDADSRLGYEALGRAGLIGLHWPVRLGGRGLDPQTTLACEELFGYHWLPLSGYLLSVKTIGNALLQYAAPDLQIRLLPEIGAGRLMFCQGFSEPDAGTDLASLRTRAFRRGNRWVISGRKIWTSSAEHADWIYLAVRTEPDAPRHRGLSVLVADMRTPGIEVTVHPTLGGGTLGEVVLDEVEVPADQVVGEAGGGWRVLLGTLDYERVTSEKVGVIFRLLDDLAPYARTAAHRSVLRQLRGAAEAARLLGVRATALLAERAVAPPDGQARLAGQVSAGASMARLSVAVLMQRLAAAALDICGPTALIEGGPDSVLDGRLAAFRRSSIAMTIAGGAADVQRRVIARQGLGL